MDEETKRQFVSRITNWVVAALGIGLFVGYWVGKLRLL